MEYQFNHTFNNNRSDSLLKFNNNNKILINNSGTAGLEKNKLQTDKPNKDHQL